MGETGTDRFVDVTTETQVEMRLPMEVDVEPEQIRKDGPFRELSIWMLLILIRKRSADSDPRTDQTEVAQTQASDSTSHSGTT